MPGSYADFPELPHSYTEEQHHHQSNGDEELAMQPSWMLRGDVYIFDYGVAGKIQMQFLHARASYDE